MLTKDVLSICVNVCGGGRKDSPCRKAITL